MDATQPVPFDGFELAKAAVLDSLVSLESRRLYERGIDRFVRWFNSQPPSTRFTKTTVQAFRASLIAAGLSSSAVNTYLIPVRRIALEAADNGSLSSEAAGAIGRVKGLRREGARTGNWLTSDQAERLINAPDRTTTKGKRDRALLAVLLGCGLRREEAASLTFEHIQQREGRWVIVDLRGKGRKRRSIPMPEWANDAIIEWQMAMAILGGCVFRPVNKSARVLNARMSAQSIFLIVKQYAAELGLQIAPHDLRRSYARLAYNGGSRLEQIQISLAHSSVVTTEKYIGVQQDFRDGPCDHLGLKGINSALY